MAIATTLPIDLSDVCLELYGNSSTSGRTLNTAFLDAIGGSFYNTYESINGYRNSLQNFRGYSSIPCCPPNFLSITVYSATQLALNFSISGTCLNTNAVTHQYSVDQVNWVNSTS